MKEKRNVQRINIDSELLSVDHGLSDRRQVDNQISSWDGNLEVQFSDSGAQSLVDHILERSNNLGTILLQDVVTNGLEDSIDDIISLAIFSLNVERTELDFQIFDRNIEFTVLGGIQIDFQAERGLANSHDDSSNVDGLQDLEGEIEGNIKLFNESVESNFVGLLEVNSRNIEIGGGIRNFNVVQGQTNIKEQDLLSQIDIRNFGSLDFVEESSQNLILDSGNLVNGNVDSGSGGFSGSDSAGAQN
mmetsp:Transcript_52745/g.60365  ORF Transcript_52745/g.60365 Transcript_52745/m.60365 type:complete len:246 (+) Transcript_52745:71-808(+)